MFADPEDIEADLIGELDLLEKPADPLFGADRPAGLGIGRSLAEAVDAELHEDQVCKEMSVRGRTASGMRPERSRDERPAIRPVAPDELELVLPLFADYQRFYGVKAPDIRTIAVFLRGFIAPSERGELIAAWDDGRPVGFANLYWTFSSVAAGPIVLLNDLFVIEGQRGAGIGRRLIEFSLRRTEERGASRLEWRTELDNRVAQRLYERFDTVRTVWLNYALYPARRK
jgi:GNAT superfamily N-acetyltransferase